MRSQAKATILLVGNDEGVAHSVQLHLERAGHVVLAVTTGDEGLRKVADGGVDLFLLDQRLSSGLSGLEFYRQVKDAGYQVPAILLVGQLDENLLVEAHRAGVRDFVPNTQNLLDHLEPIVDRVLNQVRSERELAGLRIVAREHEARRQELEHEIAQRKRVEQAYREAEVYLRLMVESVKDFAIFTIDPQGSVVSWNPALSTSSAIPSQKSSVRTSRCCSPRTIKMVESRSGKLRRPPLRGVRATSGGTNVRTVHDSSPAES